MDKRCYPGMKRLKVRGRDLSQLPVELFCIIELEVGTYDASERKSVCEREASKSCDIE